MAERVLRVWLRAVRLRQRVGDPRTPPADEPPLHQQVHRAVIRGPCVHRQADAADVREHVAERTPGGDAARSRRRVVDGDRVRLVAPVGADERACDHHLRRQLPLERDIELVHVRDLQIERDRREIA